MSALELELKSLVRETVIELFGSPDATAQHPPEYISISQAAEICQCGETVINSLIQERALNRFPAVRLGERTIRINKQLLIQWLNNGGLDGINKENG